MPIVDSAIYVHGQRTQTPPDFESTLEQLRSGGGTCWLGLYRPTIEEINTAAEEFGLHPLAVEDTLESHQRAKMDSYGDHTLLVLRPARYLDDVETIEFGELHVYTGPNFVITARQAEVPDLANVRHRMESSPDLLAMGTVAIQYAIIDQVVDEYEPVADGLEVDVEEIEADLFSGNYGVSRRIYELFREVTEFQKAVAPLERVMTTLRNRLTTGASAWGPSPEDAEVDEPEATELDRYLADVQDHVVHLNERISGMRSLLANALSLSSTLSSQAAAQAGVEQNEQMKKISAWAAIIFAPSLVGAVYGMNFENMPELDWPFGYYGALGLMLGVGVTLWAVFRHNKWL
ncbi:magnesium and cobalt transport protein CorA [Zhihengliuella salsuginis]|uniref:Magnesium transport protein CorA n=1 Tax=Zhihengliuella salsuginis TaxID=578222 RepID=A0ABQ3G9T6_9MICC|nr:magnesium and cobalt transport protein CorA [Zhihengliuella salsuginis]GHC99086.1 magnesium transport protein CorA [Zhihengliuella salsuginis]